MKDESKWLAAIRRGDERAVRKKRLHATIALKFKEKRAPSAAKRRGAR